jgi:hypothetical protein
MAMMSNFITVLSWFLPTRCNGQGQQKLRSDVRLPEFAKPDSCDKRGQRFRDLMQGCKAGG